MTHKRNWRNEGRLRAHELLASGLTPAELLAIAAEYGPAFDIDVELMRLVAPLAAKQQRDQAEQYRCGLMDVALAAGALHLGANTGADVAAEVDPLVAVEQIGRC